MNTISTKEKPNTQGSEQPNPQPQNISPHHCEHHPHRHSKSKNKPKPYTAAYISLLYLERVREREVFLLELLTAQ